MLTVKNYYQIKPCYEDKTIINVTLTHATNFIVRNVMFKPHSMIVKIIKLIQAIIVHLDDPVSKERNVDKS